MGLLGCICSSGADDDAGPVKSVAEPRPASIHPRRSEAKPPAEDGDLACQPRDAVTVAAGSLHNEGQHTAAQPKHREICNLRLCSMHPYIIRFKEAFLTDKYLAIVSEYASMGDLADYIDARRTRTRPPRGLPEEQARLFFQQLMVAVDFCHEKGIVNRDLKLENLLLAPCPEAGMAANPVIKLCDFGFSKDEYIDSACDTACGTPEYVAPEVLLTNQYSGRAADIWSAGVILYVMLTGRFPFKEAGDETLAQQTKLKAMFPRIVKAQYARPTWVSAGACGLISGMLTPDPAQRLTVKGVLTHPWFLQDLSPSAKAINSDLLKVSETLLTSFAAQSEDDILALVTEALHVPSKGGRTSMSRTPSLSSHASLLSPPSRPSTASLASLADSRSLPQRWSLDSSVAEKHHLASFGGTRMSEGSMPPRAKSGGMAVKLPSPADCITGSTPANNRQVYDKKRSTQDKFPRPESPSIPDIASYDDLFADGQILASVHSFGNRNPSSGSNHSQGSRMADGGWQPLSNAGWSLREMEATPASAAPSVASSGHRSGDKGSPAGSLHNMHGVRTSNAPVTPPQRPTAPRGTGAVLHAHPQGTLQPRAPPVSGSLRDRPPQTPPLARTTSTGSKPLNASKVHPRSRPADQRSSLPSQRSM
ncbi:hypothetical protein WJX73_000269 [Symbiochloris irregularis]|uniref:Protein kinase domain-containing protein n=1 Tax=Symbiochloris irregularis TaxID=706552 RepID=A0AAW1PG85_9CHLO